MTETVVNAIFTPLGVIGGITAIAIVVASLTQRRRVADWYTYFLVVVAGPTCFVPLWHWPTPVALSLTLTVGLAGAVAGMVASRVARQRQQPH